MFTKYNKVKLCNTKHRKQTFNTIYILFTVFANNCLSHYWWMGSEEVGFVQACLCGYPLKRKDPKAMRVAGPRARGLVQRKNRASGLSVFPVLNIRNMRSEGGESTISADISRH